MRVANEVEGQWPVANRVDPFPVEINILEAISKLPQCNQDASKVKESLVDLNFSFPTNNQSSEVWPPGQSRLNLPSTPVRPQFATILIFLGLIVFTVGTDQFNAAFQPPLAKRITVVALIRYDADRILPWPTTTFSRHRNLLNRGFQQFYFTRPGRIKISADRDCLAIDHHHPLCTLPAFGLSKA